MDKTIGFKLLELFILMFLGYYLVAGKIIKKEALKHFANLIFYVTMPAMIISTMANNVDIDSSDILTVVMIFVVLFIFDLNHTVFSPRAIINTRLIFIINYRIS